MGIKRIVDTGFWTDGKVEDFSPEDKYFMLYFSAISYLFDIFLGAKV